VRLPKKLKQGLLAVLVLAAVGFAADDVSIRYKIPASRQALGSVQVRKVYAVKRKNGSTEFLFDDPTNISCVNSLVPHMGLKPCWYLERHTEQREDICDGCDPTWLSR
jgi:hypothetical protein